MLWVNVKKLKSNASIPVYQTKGSAGVDLCAAIDWKITLQPNERYIIPSGIAIQMSSSDSMGLICPRSGLGSRGLILSNTVGIIDSDYTGEIKLAVWNTSNTLIDIEPGMRIAQLIFVKIHKAVLQEVDKLKQTERGEGGFGSTGE